MSQSGLSLTELLLSLFMLTLIGMGATASLSDAIARQRVSSATNQVLGLLYLARSESLGKGEVLLCDANFNCDRFDITSHLVVIRRGHSPDEQPTLLADLQLPRDVTLRWVRFRGQALHFHADGRTHYQNGHFLICNPHAARRIVMNWAGRPRVETLPAKTPCPA